jgi:D-beta-D-heptose 7-phosphate kinase/D-beta-D-heptose 1-phosphate adenosyltransferase
MITPNLKEFKEICNRLHLDDKDLLASGMEVKHRYALKNLLITLSDKGMMLITDEGNHPIETVKKEVFDVSGAGDTVIGTLAACLANGIGLRQSVEIANIAAGIVVGKFGTAPITLSELQAAIDHM